MGSLSDNLFPFETKWNQRDHAEMLQRCKSWLGDGEILDVGCGRGESTYYLGATGFELKKFFTWKNFDWKPFDARFLVADAVHLPFNSSVFDGVLINNVLEHVPDKESMISELKRITKPGSTYVFILPTARWKIYKFIDLPKNFIRILRGYETMDWWVHAPNVHGLNWFSEFNDFRNWEKLLSKYFHIEKKVCKLNGFQLLFKCSDK